MRHLVAAAAAAVAAVGVLAANLRLDATARATDVWPQVCATNTTGPYSAWNQTRCDDSSTCCTSGFSVSGVGCCPYTNAVCCPNGYACCPSGTTCTPVSGTGYAVVYNCTVGSTTVAPGRSVCKPGPHLPYSTTLKNVLVIGDSVSIGYTPYVAQALQVREGAWRPIQRGHAPRWLVLLPLHVTLLLGGGFVAGAAGGGLQDVALVQHAPWDLMDGGAEETAYVSGRPRPLEHAMPRWQRPPPLPPLPCACVPAFLHARSVCVVCRASSASSSSSPRPRGCPSRPMSSGSTGACTMVRACVRACVGGRVRDRVVGRPTADRPH